MKQPTRGKPTRKKPERSRQSPVSVRLPNGLRRLIAKEAAKDQRSFNNMVVKLCTDALIARGAFANANIQ